MAYTEPVEEEEDDEEVEDFPRSFDGARYIRSEGVR
jgi:hypothetical protein